MTSLQEWIAIFMRRSMRGLILFAKDNGLSVVQIHALSRIHYKGYHGIANLGDELGMTSAAASQLLDRLVRQGLLERTEDPNDRRLKLITLTPKGKRTLLEGLRAREVWWDDLARVMTPAEQEQADAALRLLIERARQLEHAPEPESPAK
ncbi:MAG: MarR family transcriptional regulator [Chloroflexi bacterium]|nr:MarR family transcriptional regulator [Anaerolineaceae bacterium]NMB86751.1 MarR family transcriptional regulator [Chloroflexota bacterium]